MKTISCLSLLAAAAALLTLGAPACAAKLDGRIIAAARQSYVFTVYLEGDDIKIESKDGAVTLTGIVEENFHGSLAEVTLRDISGVTSVDNRLEVKGSSPTANSDAWLHDKVKATLLFHRSVKAGTTEVDVKDGIVTLLGRAESAAQKQLTGEYAGDVEGVKEVRNGMTVLTAAELKQLSTNERIDDVSVAALVRMALVLHHSTSGLYTTIAARRGAITVGGRARTAAQKELVTRIIKDVDGVKKVKNLMTIE